MAKGEGMKLRTKIASSYSSIHEFGLLTVKQGGKNPIFIVRPHETRLIIVCIMIDLARLFLFVSYDEYIPTSFSFVPSIAILFEIYLNLISETLAGETRDDMSNTRLDFVD